jgi:hypothetical protein
VTVVVAVAVTVDVAVIVRCAGGVLDGRAPTVHTFTGSTSCASSG